MRRVLILGATSAIAEATARRFAATGDALFLVARDPARLEAVAADLRVRGAAQVETMAMDALDYDRHAAAIDGAMTALGGLDVALLAYGSLPDQKACEASAELTRRAFELNATSAISLLAVLGERFARQGRGTIAAISSVAGERGRQSNYLYGAAKAALTVFLSGLRNRLHGSGVHVLTVKPGFVDTPMTDGMNKAGALWAKPEAIGQAIRKAADKGGPIQYAPGLWRMIMLVIRTVPAFVFHKTKL